MVYLASLRILALFTGFGKLFCFRVARGSG